ncbi:serine O-acetyltransferase [Bacillus sp. RC252]|uniref:serine O-acetyltransferase n=1 Tax=Bacillus sp. RC252 TaxID=3156289 RepID=UPI00383601AD
MSNLITDIQRNNRNPITLLVLITYRFGNWTFYKVKIPLVRQILWFFYLISDTIFVRIIGSGELPAKCKIGKGLKLPHCINGIIIHPDAIIGENVTIFHQVTIGSVHTKGNTPPKIGNGVVICSGAKVIGNIEIGDKSKIGANAVVLKNVPENATSVGNPARNILKNII